MTNPLDQKPHDVGLINIPPASPQDPRTISAEEQSLGGRILASLSRQSRLRGWRTLPSFSFSGAQLTLTDGLAELAVYPGQIAVTTSITLPAISGSGSISEVHYVYLVGITAEVGELQDPVLGQVSFRYSDQALNQVSPLVKENARRERAFWLLLYSRVPLNAEGVKSLLGTARTDGRYNLEISDRSAVGFAAGEGRFYARDVNLAQSSYILFPDTVEVMELTRVRRMREFNERGYIWGFGGIETLSAAFHIVGAPPKIPTLQDEALICDRLLRGIFAGVPGPGRSYERTVQNFSSSSIGSNPGFPGEAAGSPNGSVCLPNNQRTTYTNQPILDGRSCSIVTASNDGSGLPVVSCTLSAGLSGSSFSGSRSDHLIYAADGSEQSSRGKFLQIGGSNLVWLGDVNSTITPGSTVYVVPGINYPAGSGFSIPFAQIERAWVLSPSVATISDLNIRPAATANLSGYELPAGGGDYIVVVGSERAAIHHIFKKATIRSSATGLVAIPAGSLGCIAFVEGVSGRIDSPVYLGTRPNADYNVLLHYPPKITEVWQWQLKYCTYQGTGLSEPTFLQGATVVSNPVLYISTQGGGNSVHRGPASSRLSPISLHLPSVTNANVPPAYRFDTPLHLLDDAYMGPETPRRLQLTSAPALSTPTPGSRVDLQTALSGQSRSLQAKLLLDGVPMGFRSPVLASRLPYQAIVAFIVEKNQMRRLVVVARNTVGGEDCRVDSDQGTAFDTFMI